MTFFLLIWIVLVVAAGGLAVGTLWGRAPRNGHCTGPGAPGCALAAWRDCHPCDSSRHNASSRVNSRS